MWTFKSWITTDLGTTTKETARLTDMEVMFKISEIVDSSRGYHDSKIGSEVLDDNGIIIYIENEKTGDSINYSFRKGII